MSLSDKEKMQIADIVHRVLDQRLDELRKAILNGFINALDWHNENFAKIMEHTNDRTLSFMEKKKREVIEINSKQYVEQAMGRQANAKKEAKISERVGFVPKTGNADLSRQT